MCLWVLFDIIVNVNVEWVDIIGSVNIFWVRIEVELLLESVVFFFKDVYFWGELLKEELFDIVYVFVMVNIDKVKIKEVKFEVFGLSVSLYGGVKVNI